MNTNIILIGPMRAGKTTIGHLLAEKLQLPQVSVDKVRRGYYEEIGYDHAYAVQLKGFERLHYWKPFEVHAVERVLQDYPCGMVIDFGAGHSVYEDPALFARVEKALASYPYVIFLTPTDDHEEAVRILHQRDLDAGESGLSEMNGHFVRHDSNRKLAKFTVYTKDKTPEQTFQDVLALLG